MPDYLPRLQQRKAGLCWSGETSKEPNECELYTKQIKEMMCISIVSEVFCEFCHPIQAEPKACSKDIHIFLEKNEK